jgi:hypothetical protein
MNLWGIPIQTRANNKFVTGQISYAGQYGGQMYQGCGGASIN